MGRCVQRRIDRAHARSDAKKELGGATRNCAFFVQRTLMARVFDCITRMASQTEGDEPAPGDAPSCNRYHRAQPSRHCRFPRRCGLGRRKPLERNFRTPRRVALSRLGRLAGRFNTRRGPTGRSNSPILAALDRFFSMMRAVRRGGAEPAANRIQPSDALVASIYSSINAAYVYPELDYMHETLMLGAWLGFLERGRPALMPDYIAAAAPPLSRRKARKDPGHGRRQMRGAHPRASRHGRAARVARE